MRTTFLFSFLLCVGFLLMAFSTAHFVAADDDIEMVFIKGGSFEMGSNDGESNEKPVHTVTVNGFYMSKYEVTVAQFKDFVTATNYKTDAEKGDGSYILENGSWGKKAGISWRNNTTGGTAENNHPVIHVSWNDAVTYTQWLAEKTGKNYRLPTEAEWEYAAKGGQNYKYAGSDNLDEVAWYGDNSNQTTHPVGQKLPNGYGLYDMSGNVWEWCQDVWHNNYNGAPINGSAWTSGGEVSRRVLRGGSWLFYDGSSRVQYRYMNDAATCVLDLGFRLARD